MFLVVPPLLDRPVRAMLVIGNAGGTIARAYGRSTRTSRSTASRSIPRSPSGTAFPGPRRQPEAPRRHGRRAAVPQATDKRYDVIVVDAYRQPYIPFYLATKEFFGSPASGSSPAGSCALNVAAVPGDDRLCGRSAAPCWRRSRRRGPGRRCGSTSCMVGFDRPVRRGRAPRAASASTRRSPRSCRCFAGEVAPVRAEAAR